jgi:16S rRNA (uracil1498-N3)-methyltransferase
MKLPFFYKEDLDATGKSITLDEASSKHIVQVLRMQNGEQMQLTNGKGNLYLAEITDNNRKRCEVKLIEVSIMEPPSRNICIAISLLKNTNRLEWFLEKATEIGVSKIIPLLCERTEKTAFKFDRLNGILVSAMLQSQQAWLPVLHEPVKFMQALNDSVYKNKFIAHCEDEANKKQLTEFIKEPEGKTIMLIGPEGDFSMGEISAALAKGFAPVALGNTRLRTETAGIVAATLLCNA